MRYHYEKSKLFFDSYGETYYCNHPVYNKCTLYMIGDRGLAVIQQRYDAKSKATYWTDIDVELKDKVYTNPGFYAVFNNLAKIPNDDLLFPTITIRQLMWALKMKPLEREPWETYFDKKGF